jgi:toxin ParE1/3/4
VRIEWKVEASTDLDRVFAYVEENRPGDEHAEIESLFAAVELVATQPNAGRPGRVTGTREWVAVYPWVIVYKVEQRSRLVIVRVLHGKQKWP